MAHGAVTRSTRVEQLALDRISHSPHPGDQLSIADLHVVAWLARLGFLAGASATDDGDAALAKIEAHVGHGDAFALPKDFSVAEARRRAGLAAADVEPTARQSRLAALWDAMQARPSWKKVYADGLH